LRNEWSALNDIQQKYFNETLYGDEEIDNPEYDGLWAVGYSIYMYGLFLSYMGFVMCMYAMHHIY